LIFTNHLVAYVDVLGFKDIILGLRGNAIRQNDFLSAYLIDAARIAKDIQNTKEKSDIKLEIKVISDTFFFSIPSNEANLGRHLAHICAAVGFLQSFLSSKGIWTRGSITYGELIKKNGNIVGPALIESFLLEQNDAVFPRVILDTRLLKFFSSQDELIREVNEPRFSNWKGNKIFVNRDSLLELDYSFEDELLFVDYFNAFLGNSITRSYYVDSLKFLKLELQNKPAIYKKHKWTQKYFLFKHYEMVQGMSGIQLESEDLSFFSSNAPLF
jgi:hypothetical protein